MEPIDPNRTGPRNLVDLLRKGTDIPLLQTPLAVFRCPSDSTPALMPYDPPEPAATRTYDNGQYERHFKDTAGSSWPDDFQPSMSNYIGSAGFVDSNCDGSVSNGKWVPDALRCANNGIFFGNGAISMRQISDGTSKTFIAGERDRYCLTATWIRRGILSGRICGVSKWINGITAFKLNDAHTGISDTCTEGFSSPHPGGAYFAFCDGSVHFISDDVSYDYGPNNKDCFAVKGSGSSLCKSDNGAGSVIGVYQRLSWRDDGLEVDGAGL